MTHEETLERADRLVERAESVAADTYLLALEIEMLREQAEMNGGPRDG